MLIKEKRVFMYFVMPMIIYNVANTRHGVHGNPARSKPMKLDEAMIEACSEAVHKAYCDYYANVHPVKNNYQKNHLYFYME